MEAPLAISARKTIAFIVNDISGSTSYENDLWTGVHDAAVERDVDLLVIAGGDFNEKARNGKADPRNMIYGLFRPEEYDGIILATTTTCMGLNAAETARFAERFGARPFVMLNGIPGKHRSLVDNEGGAYAAIEHLIKAHGKKRIAYIRGPEGTEADERFAAYKDALADNGLPFDERLVYMGKFLQSSGVACAKELIEVRKADFDAIGAANDSMAIGMIKGLKERGFRVPRDIAVTGFDDTEGAAYHNPPLSTVRQPVYKQARRAVEMACDLMAGKAIQADQTQATEPIYRQSCGCNFLGRGEGADRSAGPLSGAGRFEEADFSARILKAVGDAGLGGADSARAVEFSGRVAAYLRRDAHATSPDSIFSEFDEIGSSAMEDISSARAWRNYVEKLKPLLAGLGETPSDREAADKLWLALDLMASEMTIRAEGMRKLTAARNAVVLREVSESISVTYEVDEIIGLLDSTLPRVGISGYSLAEIADGNVAGPGGNRMLRQIHAFVDGKALVPAADTALFPASSIFLRGPFAGKRRTIVAYPLTFGSELTGIIAMEAASGDGGAFLEIARRLSGSMAGARLLEESRHAARSVAERSERIERLTLPMIESLERVARLATEKSRDVRSIADMAKRSFERLDGTIGTMEKTSGSVGNMAELIGAIDDISTTINLVSLNASIEASRAGQFGRGFAVIAKEVKKLAESTQVKSSEISSSIKTILDNMGKTADSGKQCLDSYRAEETGVKTLIEIFEAITRDMEVLAQDGRRILDTMKG
jgi:phosphoserine phosphatase RsbU/P